MTRACLCWTIAALMLSPVSMSMAQHQVRFDKTWWVSLDKDEHWDFIYGFTDCGKPIRSGLNMAQYENFITANVSSNPTSVPQMIRLAPRKVKALTPIAGGEVWTERHGFNDGDLWGDHAAEGRAWVEGYMACEERPVTVAIADRCVRLMLRHYANPKRHLDKLADVLEPLLPPKQVVTQP